MCQIGPLAGDGAAGSIETDPHHGRHVNTSCGYRATHEVCNGSPDLFTGLLERGAALAMQRDFVLVTTDKIATQIEDAGSCAACTDINAAQKALFPALSILILSGIHTLMHVNTRYKPVNRIASLHSTHNPERKRGQTYCSAPLPFMQQSAF